MKTVLLRGPVFTQSGYGVHTRQIARWLLSHDDITLRVGALQWGHTPWITNRGPKGRLIDRLMERSVPVDSQPDVSFQVQLPNEWDPKIARFNVGISACVETDICHPSWPECCNKMNAIVVPSNHAKNVLLRSGNVNVPLYVIPEAYVDDCAAPELTGVELPDFSTPFNFLVFGQLTGDNPFNDRKNLFFTIRWLCEVFADDPDVGIVLKANAGRNTRIDRQKLHAIVRQIVSETRKGLNPRIHVLHGAMNDREVAALYRHPTVKALVTLTRGEGFGLPILEAAASGLPVIATGWSGHTDFLNRGKYVKIHHQLDQIHPSRVDGNIFLKEAKWANVSEEDFKKRIKKFRNSNSIPREWASNLRKIVIDKYSFTSIAQAYEDTFGEELVEPSVEDECPDSRQDDGQEE